MLIGGLPAARVGDMATCVGPPDVIALGSFTVLTMNQPQARIGDTTGHGGKIVLGCFTVLVGEKNSPFPRTAKFDRLQPTKKGPSRMLGC